MPTPISAAWLPATPPPMITMSAGGTPGTPPSSTPRPPFSFSRQRAPTWGAMRPATSDIGVSKRQRAFRAGHRLVGDGDHARRHQIGGLRRIGRQMQIGEQDLPGPSFLRSTASGSLTFTISSAAAEHLIGVGHDLGAGRLVIGIGETGAQAGVLLDHDAVAVEGELPHRRGHQARPGIRCP